MAAAVNGDLIEVLYGDYVDCAWVDKSNLTIRGVPNGSGARPHFHDKVCGRKGILVVSGTNTLVENLELSHAQDTGYGDNNWAGIRLDSGGSAANLKVRNVYFHDDDNGILGSNGTPVNNIVEVEKSIFERCGRDGYAHGMYIGDGVSTFNLRNSMIRNNANDGHLVKTRAVSGTIECNTIAALNGASSYAIDMPEGGNYLIRHNVVENGPNINNGGNFFIQYAEENQSNAPHKLQLENNFFVNDYGAQGRINVATSADTSGWAGNIFAGTGGSLQLLGYVGPNSFTNYVSRAAASLPSFDGTTNTLPPAPVCP